MSEVSVGNVTPSAAPRQGWTALGITLAATAVALLVDRFVYELFNAPNVYDKDLGRLLRVMGFAGTWLALALAVGFQHDGTEPARRIARRRGWLIFWSPMLAGALAEVLKVLVRRERPAINDGEYGFRPWDERTWSGAGLAFPSSHAAVAFSGAFMLARVFPRARWVGFVLAVGCGITRIVARAHFVSDVAFAAGLGYLVSWLLWRRWAPRDARGAVVALALVALPLLALPTGASAQQATAPLPAPSAAPAPAECTAYERCALGLLPRFTGLAVVRGVQEEQVAMLGFFIPGRSLDAAFAGDSLAQRYGREAHRARWIGAILTTTGLLTAGAAGPVAINSDDQISGFLGTVALAGVQLLGAVYYQFKADAELSRAVFAYNRRFARP
jgi:membrane-associated phospholipid phosphatase